ncbi:MAG: SMP-30/gluconolactonase/LRE family protein [Chloroflexi bacterium]|nr:SMP-30/gluconolactonase/LRE family protein [Chloroflexota bacterium]
MKTQLFASEFHKIIASDTKLEQVSSGYQFVEGPLWNPQEKTLIFSDILGNTLYQWSENRGSSILRRNSHMANGNAHDLQGRILTCEHATSRLTRTDFSADGALEILATHYDGKELNSPNDVICKRDGSVYFTDPDSGRSEKFGVPRPQQLDFQGVYRRDARDPNLLLLVDDFSKPNGLCFSRNEKHLFVNDTDRGHIRIFDVADDGTLHNGKIWAELKPVGIGVADGMKIDTAGNLYSTGPGGIHIFDKDAKYLGIIHTPEQATNLAWGDSDLQSLYITATTSIYRLRTLISGHKPLG